MAPDIKRKIFEPRPDPGKIATAEYILKNISNPEVVLLDVRPERNTQVIRSGQSEGDIFPGQ